MLKDVWFVMLNFLWATERSFSRSTSNTDHRRPIRERINVKNWTNTSPLTSRFTWGLLKGRRMPAPSQCTLIANLRMLKLRLLRNHHRIRALFEIKTSLWSAESTSVNIAPHDWSQRASAAGQRRRRLRATTTGDLTARGYCSFQVTKCDKKLTSVS